MESFALPLRYYILLDYILLDYIIELIVDHPAAAVEGIRAILGKCYSLEVLFSLSRKQIDRV